MSRLSNLYATLEANGINMPKDISVFEKNMGDSAYRRKLYKGLQEKGLRLKQSEDEFDAIWSKEFGESKPKSKPTTSKPTTDEDLAKTYVMSPEWQEDYARGKEVEKEIKAGDAKRKQTADAYNAYAKLEDSFAKYEQSQDMSDLFNVGQQEPIFGEDPKKYWRNKVAQRKEGEAQAKAKVDQEREELRQRMQLLKDNPDAYNELFGIKVKETPEVGLNLGNSFSYGKPVDKRGNVHDNWVSQAQANQRIDAEDKARQLGMQADEIQDMLADPMALSKTMRDVEAEIERLGKARDEAAQKFSSENPFKAILFSTKGTRSLDPWLEGAYGPEAQAITLELEKAFAKLDNLKNIEKKIKSGELPRGGFWNGLGQMGQAVADKVTDRSWGMYEGMSNMLSESEKQIVFDKIAKGEPLTASEMQWATIDLLEKKANTEVDSPYLYNITSGLMESAPYMRDIFLSPGKGISDAFVNWGKSRYGATGFLKLVGNALQGAATTATVGADELVSGTSERMRGDLSFGENGLEVTGQKSLGRALSQQFASQTASNMVELMGVPLLDKAGKYIGKAVKEVADGLSYGKVSKVLSAMDKSSAVNWVNGVRKSMGIHSLPAEIGEEYVDAFAQSIVEGEDQLSPMLNTEEFLNIAGTCGLMSAIFGFANVAGFAGEFHKVNREFKKAKQEVLRQFSSDVWASLDNLITNAQDEDLTVRLADAMDGMAMNREQRSAIKNYLTALKRYQKFNELNDGGKFIIGGPQQTQATQSTSTSTSTYEIDSDITLKDEIGNPIDAHIIGRDANGNYMVESSQPINGKRVQPMSADQLDAMVIPNTPDGIQQSEVDGYNLTDANQQAEVSMLTDNARESVATLLGVTPDAVDATLQQVLGDNPTDAKIDARFGGNAQVVKDYMYDVAKTKGMSARLIDDIADATAESDRAIDAVDNNGNVVTAKDVNGNDVNVVSGNIVTYEDGQIDVANSDASVVIRHADGTTEMVVPTSLTEVVSMPIEQAKATQAQAIAQQMQQVFSDRLNGALDYSQGQQYTMLNADGSTTDVTILADNGDGNVTVTARDGNKQGGVTDGKEMVLPKSQIQQGVREFKRNELRAQKAKQTSVPQAESAPTEVAEPIQEPSMPTDEQGNILYEQMDADSAWDALLAETGGDADMAMTVANEMIADKTKAVEEASKMVAEPGTTPQEKIANLKAVKQAQAQAQAELDAWKAIAETPNRRMSLQAEQAEQADLQTESTPTESTPTESESTPQVGLVEDARTRTLGDKTRKMLDAMAKRLGLQVEFVDEIVTGKDEKGRNLYANAVIVGKNVKIAWHNRNRAVDFLLGHEFTHRMQDLSPETYAEFVEAAKQALGEEEWNKRINRMRDIYKSQGKTISEQGIIDEVVADYAGELVEERGVFDNFVERNKNNRSLLARIADVLRSIKEFFTLGKQRKINNAIARLEALIESASEANLRGDVVNMEKERYSVSSIFEGTGAIVFNEEGGANIDKDGNFYVIINGKQYDGNNLISLDDIKADKRSVLNLMVEDAIKEGNVTEEHADVIMKKYVDIMNMFLVEGLAENGGYANMADKWMWVGSTVYKSVAKNGDKQYLKSIDITRVCKKNEAVIRAISEMQKRVGYGITPAQILDIYVESYESGYQVPCPVCYVFSRYLRNGKYASGAILGMEQYGEHLPGGKGETWTAEQWVAELRRLEEIDNNNKTLYDRAASDIVEAETMIDDLGIKFQQATSEAERKALRAEIEKTDARYRAALNIFSQSALTQWIKQFAIIGNPARLRDDAKYPDNIESFKEHALDVRKSAETMTLYPAIRRLRNSGGSTVGKEIAYESNNDLGEVIAGLASASADASNNAYQKTIQSKDDKEFEANRKKATEQFQKASQYIKQQTLRGGQRMWSWSDNIEALMPDIVINLMQLELLGGALQTYSKQLEGVNLVARSGGYVNGSLMAKDNGYAEVTEDMIKIENGQEVLAEDITEDIEEPTVKDGVIKRTRVLAQAGSPIFKADGKKYVLIFDDVIGIDPHGDEGKLGLFDLNKMLSKAGNIIVGMNDTHIRVGLADSRIFFIIPWHSSGANNHILAEMFRVLGADIESMVSQDYEDVQNEKDYGNKVPQSVTDIWESNKNEKDFECGIKGGIDSSQGKISESQKHYRELREAIFNGTIRENRVWLREVQNDEFLKQVLDRVETDTLTVKTKDGKLVHMMEKEDNNHIYPYEYWDTSKTYSEADINGERYIEYCRRLGFSPKFSGNHEGANPNEFGNFTNDKGYWKLLVDRRMYDINGEFQDLDPVTTKDYTNELVHPSDTHKKFKVSQVADAKATSKIVDRVIEKETERFGGEMPMVDYTLSHDEVYKNYKAEHDLLMADEAYRKAVGEVAEAQKNVDAVLVTGETKSIAKAKSRLVSKQLALAEARKNATKADKVATKARQRYSLSNLTEEEQRIVDEAKANGTYLKAPNGKASNLNERQWIQVRTKAFKDWFGDWENDPENASKVVDENGEPKVVYHGSYSGGFASFRKSDTGIYFADYRKAVEDYAYEDTEDVDNYLPFDRDSEISVEEVNEWISNANLRQLEKGSYIKEHKVLNDVYWELRHPNGKPYTNIKGEEYITTPLQMKYILLEYARTSPEFKGKGVYSTFLDMKNPFVIDAESKSWHELPKTINGVTIPEKYMVVHQKPTVSTDEWAEFLQSEEGKALGFDGMVVKNVYDSQTADGTITDYIAFDPTQIKSATDNVGTFDKSNPDIRYSLQNKYGIKVGEIIQVETIRDLFNEWNSNEELSELFDKVYDVASKLTFDIAFDKLEKNALGLYNAAAGLMEFSDELLTDKIKPQRKAQTILHELIHSVTTYAMYIDDYKVMQDVFGNLSPNVKRAVDMLNEVYDEIKNKYRFRDEYGITDSKEMVAELANARFRNKLKDVGLWQKIVDAIKELFGITTDTVRETRFDRVDNALNELLDNFDRSLWAQTASMGEKIFFDEGNDVRYSLASDMARDENMQSLLKNTPLWNDVAKTMSNADDYTIAEEVLNKLDEDAVNSAKEAIDNANEVFAKADATDVANRLERALQMMRNAEVSEDEGQQIRYSLRTKPDPKKTIKVYKLFNVDENGNPQALFIDAANSLETGVWYDADSPTIKDLENLETEWSYLLDNDGNVVDKKPLKRGKGGNFVGLPSKAEVNKATQEGQRWMTVSTSKSGEKAYHTVGINGAGGVSTYALRPGWHATNVPSARHIGVGKDGANAKYRGANQRWFEIEISADVDYNEEARERYLKAHPTYSREKAYSDLKGDIPERIPEDGYYNFKTNSNANPNQDWYIAGAIKIVRPLTEEEGRKISRSKGIAEDLPYKDGEKNFDDSEVRYSLQGGRSIADKYEKRVNTKGVGGALHLSAYNAKEAFQDGELALKEVQRIIEQEYGIVLESYEDAYMAENAMSSIAKASWDRYISEVYEPMMRIHDEWIRSGESNESINHYLIAKSGLERNRELMVRDALAEMNKTDAQIINGEYSGTVLKLANALRQGLISQDEYDVQVQEAKNKKAQALEDVKSVQQGRVDAYRAERDALREQLKNGDISYEEFNRLSDEVALKHAKTEEIADYSGLTALAKMYGSKDWQGFAEQMVRDFEAKHSNTDVMWEHINNNTKSAVDYSYKSGVTSKQAKDHLDQMFLWYVPMKGNADVEAEDIYTYVNDKSSSFTPTVKGAKGHSEYVSEDIMALIANTMQSAILQGERNKMKQKFLNMVQNYPTDLFTLDRGWVVMQGNEWVESHPEIKADYTPEQIREAIEKHDAEMRELEEQGLAMSKEGALKLGVPFRATQNEQEHAISVMRNGQKVTIYVNGNPRVAQALNGNLKADSALAWYEFYKRWFSAAKTSYSPNFIVTNTQRDTGLTLAMTFKQRGFKEMFKALGAYAPAYKTLLAHAMGKKTNSKYDQYFDEFVRNGGITGYSTLHSVDEFKTDNAKRMARLKGAMKAIRGGVNTVKAINKVFQEVNGIFENVSRFNEYIRSRERGDGVATSVFNAKNITVNFNKKGGGKKTDSLFHQFAYLGRMIIPFFNPTMQGIYQFFKVDNNMQKMRLGLACFAFLGNGFLTPILNAFLVTLLGDGDEDDYMKQPEWVRRNNFMIFTGDGYAKFALPQMFREFYGMGDILYCAIKGNMTAEEAAEAMVGQIANVFSLNGVSTYFDWIRDIAMNTNFMGNPLWKENDFNKYDPEYQKAYNSTWSWLVDFSEKVNKWTGGDEHTASDVSGNWMNPAVWQRIITEIGGGVVETVGDVFSLINGDDIDYSNIPLVKRLYAETNDETLQKWIDKEYFSNLDNYKKVKDRMSSLKSSPLDVAEKIDFMYHSPEYLEYVIFDDAQKEIKELRDKADSATDDNRTEREKALYDAELEVVEAIDAVRAMGDNEVQTFMMQHPEVAYYINKDIERKVKDNVKELQKAIARKEPNAREALSAYRKSPEYKYYNEIRRRLKRINKLESRLNDDTKNATPSRRLEWQKKIDDEKKELVELRKAYESIGEVKE